MAYIGVAITVLCALSGIACSEQTIRLDNRPVDTLSFGELPQSVQTVIIHNLVRLSESGKRTNKGDFFACTDSNVIFQYGRQSMGQTLDYASNLHHFFVNGRHLVLRGNKGEPFVLDNKNLYWSNDPNVGRYNYEDFRYFRVDISDVLEEW